MHTISCFSQTIKVLEDEEDINHVTDYFSYEHFYVIYCKFWELDKDHDLYISKEDLARHNDHGTYAARRTSTMHGVKTTEILAIVFAIIL